MRRWTELQIMVLALSSCSPSEPRYHPTIVGGELVTTDNAVVALKLGATGRCSGTKIGPKTILTAAHCLRGRIASQIEIQVGLNAKHPNFAMEVSRIASEDAGHDIGVVIARDEIPSPTWNVARASVLDEFSNATLTLYGYGYSWNQYGVESDTATLQRLPSKPIQVTPLTIVFGPVDGGTCNGDSGGPSTLDNSESPVVVGVHQKGMQLCGVQSVDTRVDCCLAWINSERQ